MTAANQTGNVPAAEQSRSAQGWRGSGWIAALSVALLATSQWLSATSVGYLVLAATATALATGLAWRLRRPARGWPVAGAVFLAVAVIVAFRAQRSVAVLSSVRETESAALRDAALSRLQDEVVLAAAELDQRARAALSAPEDRAAAFEYIRRLAADGAADLTLYRGDSALAWVGQSRVRMATQPDTVGVAGSPFYLVLYVDRRAGGAGGSRAVASRLLYATPPADRSVASLGGDVVRATGIAAFRFVPPNDSASLGDARVVRVRHHPLFAVNVVMPSTGEMQLRVLERARVRVGALLSLALACFVIAGWRVQRGLRWRAAVAGVGVLVVALAPLSAFSNRTQFFDPAIYYTQLGGALTANAAALGLTSALVLLVLLSVVRRRSRVEDRRLSVATVVLVAGLGPFLLRDLARGIQIPASGVSASLWLTWEVPLFLAAVAVMLSGAAAGSAALGRSRGLPAVVAPSLAVFAAVLAPVVWEAPGQFPWWYPVLWILAIASLAVSRRTTAMIVSAAAVSALGATTLVWGATTRARVRLAEQDIAMLAVGDPEAPSLAARLSDRMAGSGLLDRRTLLERYATSELAAAGFPVWLASWRGDGRQPVATLATAPLPVPVESLRTIVRRARAEGRVVTGELRASPATQHVVAVPSDSGAVTIVVAPRSRLIPPDPFARLLGVAAPDQGAPPYSAQVFAAPPNAKPVTPGRSAWRREGDAIHGDWIAATGAGVAHAHVEVELRSLEALFQRGALIALLDLAIVGLIWLTSVLADGVAARWLGSQRRKWSRSYRTRLTLALFAFFMVPAIVFAVWSGQQLSVDASRARELLVRETLRSVTPSGSPQAWVESESRRLGAPLFLYMGGELTAASDSLLDELAPMGRLLDPAVALALMVFGEERAQRVERSGSGASMLFGYRKLDIAPGLSAVVAAPARSDDATLDQRAQDLFVLVLFATAVGALAALWLSGIAARQLARPIGSLRSAALALAGGESEPALDGRPTTEFLPVFAAFRRMMSDLSASRSALEEAQRRTATVLRNAASGVIAVDDDGFVTLANPRADELMGVTLMSGTPLPDEVPAELADLVKRFLRGHNDDEAFEMRHRELQWRGRLTRLAGGGAVLTVDDVTDMARAERVLAWGEMARQVAHEIKNPLTPIRLGVQHLKRARSDPRVDFDNVLDKNVERILREIDRLDEIARAFSRYGQPPENRAAPEPTDVAAVLRDVVALETMGDDQVKWSLEGATDAVRAMARREELREVLLNILENARLARATRVRCVVSARDGRVSIAVADDGHGIAADHLPRIFEPHFSTRTSGSGLGLAVSRRLIESWGGTIEITSTEGKGTDVVIGLANSP
jgi:two-component system nitrogen regulation sensor histidine kinase NtrY